MQPCFTKQTYYSGTFSLIDVEEVSGADVLCPGAATNSQLVDGLVARLLKNPIIFWANIFCLQLLKYCNFFSPLWQHGDAPIAK